MALPSHAKYLIIGAGIHGLSTAYHLALELKSRREGSGRDIPVLDQGRHRGRSLRESPVALSATTTFSRPYAS